MTRYLSFEAKRLEPNRLLGFHQVWVTATADDVEAELITGAGFGSLMIGVRITRKGETQTEYASVKDLFETWVKGMVEDWEPLTGFVHKGTWSNKVMCTVCGRDGYGPALDPERDRDADITHMRGQFTGWQRSCLRGHKPCPKCGVLASVTKYGLPRKHPRCPVEVRK